MTIALKRPTSLTLTAWLLAVAILAPSLSLPLSAQAIREQNAVLEGSEQDPTDQAHDPSEDSEEAGFRRDGDNYKSPKAAERNMRRQEALQERIRTRRRGKVDQVAGGQFVEMELERNDRVFVILVEFGSQASTSPTVPSTAGPLHNEIGAPNRALDNSTIWQADYNPAHYQDMYFRQMVDYYRTQSSGRYMINGDVTEWVKVPFNGPRYGSNTLGDASAWTLIADGINTWTKDQLASGKSLADVTEYLKTFDQWDRYDYNNNGNFDEPDGYIDHFQIVHSGVGEETGGGAQGTNAIWSHRWQAWYNRAGVDGPTYNKDGGIEFGGGWGANPTGSVTGSSGASVSSANPTAAATVTYAHPVTRTGIWVGDYTIQPENGGLGVFAHEYGHDLGLPDHYDTTNASSNSTGFWTVMSSGSYLGDGTADIGSTPGDFGAWDKLQLGWLDYDVATAGVDSDHKLGPAETNTKKAQAIVVSLPRNKNDLFLFNPAVAHPYGSNAWWGGRADNLDTTMTREVLVPAAPAALSMRLKYDIENSWDYAYVSVSTNNGNTWTNLVGTYLNGAVQSPLTTNTNPNGQNLGNGITGTSTASATAPGGWRLASFNMNAYAGQSVLLRLRYKTDPFVARNGLLVDQITLGTFTDGAENGSSGWSMNGFKATNGVENANADHFYIAEYRQYRTYDSGLQTGPYTFGTALTRPKWVAHYPYQDGMLVTYWDQDQANNNTSTHPGEGLALPVDAHPEPLRRVVSYDGQNWTFNPWSATVQAYDSTFGLEATDALTLPFTGSLPPPAGSPSGTPNRVVEFEVSHPTLPAVPVFRDLNNYWFSATPAAGVIAPRTGTSIRVVNTSAQGTMMQVHVRSEQ